MSKLFTTFSIAVVIFFDRNHKKWKDSLEGSLDRVLFKGELEA